MILSVSRRTDIPARYADWFFHRLQDGYALSRNPMNYRQVSKIPMTPDVLDGIVFWTKNPLPMADRLDLLHDIPYYFQFTLTPYGSDLEPGVPRKNEVLIPAFQALSRQLGPQRFVWRYDPILITPRYDLQFHLDAFRRMAQALSGCCDTCVISFFDSYSHLNRTVIDLGLRSPSTAEIKILADEMSETAQMYGFHLHTCTETIDLSGYGISNGKCIDAERLSQIGGIPLRPDKDPHQRPGCGCAASVDIGMYDSCENGCKYCYANHSSAKVHAHSLSHNPFSPLLYGTLDPNDTVRERVVSSLRDNQLRLF